MSKCLLDTDKKHSTDYKFSKFTMISYIILYSFGGDELQIIISNCR